MAYIRTFVAIDLDASVRGRTAELVRRWQDLEARINWVERENMHLTLKFLGDIEDRRVPEVCSAVQQAAAAHRPFEVQCQGVGAFPAVERARTIWIGVEQSQGALAALSEDVDEALHAVGYPMESRRYHGHLTIGRVRDPCGQRDEIRRRIEAAADFQAGSSLVNQVVVYSSVLERRGPQYGVLSRVRLKS